LSLHENILKKETKITMNVEPCYYTRSENTKIHKGKLFLSNYNRNIT